MLPQSLHHHVLHVLQLVGLPAAQRHTTMRHVSLWLHPLWTCAADRRLLPARFVRVGDLWGRWVGDGRGAGGGSLRGVRHGGRQ